MIQEVWSRQPGKYMCVSTRDRKGKSWEDHMFSDINRALSFISATAQKDGIDLYWAPMKFDTKARDKKHVAAVKYLWQDLDFCSPDKIPKGLEPTILWESSPGRYHALWELEDTVDVEAQQAVNKALAYRLAPMGCDKGGWDRTQVLRIPGTRNWKYKNGPMVKLLGAQDRTVSLQALGNRLDVTTRQEDKKASDRLVDVQGLTYEGVLAKHRGQISRKVLSVLLADEAPEGKRSDTLWWLGHELIKSGLSTSEAYMLIKGSVWNKYKDRDDEEERLTHELARAFEDEVIDGGSKDRKPGSGNVQGKHGGSDTDAEDEDGSDDDYSLTITTDAELMADLSAYPGWLVDSIWTRRSHGIVAGEPKSFKSTLLTDLAVSVASGRPFLGQFEVHEQGPVLVIQNENAAWIMKDRLAKVRAGKDLLGKAWVAHGEIWVEWAPELPIYYINQQGFMLTDPMHRKLVAKALQHIKEETGQDTVLVILDPLYLMFDGDLNVAKDLHETLQWLLKTKTRYNFSLILVHHWNKNGASSRGGQRMLGSTTLHGWTESAWYLKVGGGEAEETDEDADSEDREAINRTAASAEITMEREFRGAGMFPKLDIKLQLGAFGEATYSAEIGKHESKKKGKGVDKDMLGVEILQALDISTTPLSLRRLTEEVGAGRRVVTETCKRLEEEGKIVADKKGYRLVR